MINRKHRKQNSITVVFTRVKTYVRKLVESLPAYLFLSSLHILLYSFVLILDLWAEKEETTSHTNCHNNYYVVISETSVVLFTPAGSVWTECRPLGVCSSSPSLCHLSLHSAPASYGRCEAPACTVTTLSCGWRPSSGITDSSYLHHKVVLSWKWLMASQVMLLICFCMQYLPRDQ